MRRRADLAGWNVLAKGGSALDACEAAVRVLEEDPAFDAGVGSVLNADAEVEMDAMIMCGESLNAGAVAAIRNVKNPVTVARAVMEQTPHCLLVGDGARAFADELGIPFASTNELVTEAGRAEYDEYAQQQYKGPVESLFHSSSKCEQPNGGGSGGGGGAPSDGGIGHDTVGAAAVDAEGRVAAATSTGGITWKRPGRVGDSPLPGAGGYADSSAGACSATGHGESIMRYLTSARAVEHLGDGQGPDAACRAALHGMFARLRGRGGLVMVDSTGRVGKFATTTRMVWASRVGVAGSDTPEVRLRQAVSNTVVLKGCIQSSSYWNVNVT